jgi:hypothetical protein
MLSVDVDLPVFSISQAALSKQYWKMPLLGFLLPSCGQALAGLFASGIYSHFGTHCATVYLLWMYC